LAQVYIQVQALFKNEEDLLSEFKDFLPEIAGTSAQQGGLVGIRPYPPDGPSASGAMWSHETTAMSSGVPKGTQAPSRRRKREPPKEPPPPSKQAEPARVSDTNITRRNGVHRSQRIVSARVWRGPPRKATCNRQRLRVIKPRHRRFLALLTTPNRTCPNLAITSKVTTWHRPDRLGFNRSGRAHSKKRCQGYSLSVPSVSSRLVTCTMTF
jgi:hypothetical protein